MEGKGPYASIIGWKFSNQVRFMAEGSLPKAGSALEFLKNEAHLIDEFGELHGIIHSVPDSGGVFFSPTLNGFRPPLNDATAKAGFLWESPAGSRRLILSASAALSESMGLEGALKVCCLFPLIFGTLTSVARPSTPSWTGET